MDHAIHSARTSSLTHWKRITPKALIEAVRSRHLVPLSPQSQGTDAAISFEVPADLLNQNVFVSSYSDVLTFLRRLSASESTIDEEKVRAVVAAYLGEVFMQGSQIHQNAAFLLRLGLPLVKLDGLYRGMFSMFDVDRLLEQLQPKEQAELRHLLMGRPFGGDTLIGWKRAAFLRGYL